MRDDISFVALDGADLPRATHAGGLNDSFKKSKIALLRSKFALVATTFVVAIGVCAVLLYHSQQAPSVASVNLQAGCVTRQDCSDKGDCVNGKCYCDSRSFYGDNCEKHYACIARSDCQDHGDCVNGVCHCETGFSGETCDKGDVCPLQCAHGGQPDAACKTCVGCAPGWIGDLCNTWDPSVSPDAVSAHLQTLAEQSKANQEKAKQFNPLPGLVGLGVDVTSRAMKLPVVKLTYEGSTRTWTNSKGVSFREPLEATFKDFQSTGLYNPIRSVNVFKGMKSYLEFIATSLTSHAGPAGFFMRGTPMATIFQTFFAGDRALAVAQQAYPLYEMSLPVDPVTRAHQFELDPICKSAIDSLPPDYTIEANRKLYRLFIDLWGTSYTSVSKNGGLVEILSHIDSSIWSTGVNPSGQPYSDDQVKVQADVDFNLALGQGASQPLEDGYKNHRAMEDMTCSGGVPENRCNAAGLPEYVKTIEQNPIPIEYEVSDIPELIQDVAVRTNVQNAIQEYIKEKMDEWFHMNFCPSCAHGSCTPPNEFCTCDGRWAGKTCNVCQVGFTGDDCNTPICNPPCKFGSCAVNGNGQHYCACRGKAQGSDCSVCPPGWGGNDCWDPQCNMVPCMRGWMCTCPDQCCNGPRCGENLEKCRRS